MTETAKKLDPIQEAIARSKEQAAQVATVVPTSTAVAVAPETGMSLSMDSMMAGGMSVDKWLKVKPEGLKIGDSGLIVGGPIRCSIDMTENRGFVLKYSIKGGDPAQYASSTDMVTAIGGGAWTAAVARIKALQPDKRTDPYRCVDLPFTIVTPEIKDMKGAVVAKEGDTLGYSTSTTNWANWVIFYKTVSEHGLLGKRVLVDLSAEERKGNGREWGVVKFDFVGEFQESE